MQFVLLVFGVGQFLCNSHLPLSMHETQSKNKPIKLLPEAWVTTDCSLGSLNLNVIDSKTESLVPDAGNLGLGFRVQGYSSY